MQLFAILSAAAVASATAVFHVSDFSAGCIPHSTQCLYTFGVLQPGTMEKTPVTCKALVPANNDGTLPDVKEGTCEESSRTWSIVRSAEGLTLTVSQQVTPNSFQSGAHLLPNDEFVMNNQPNAVVQTYTGPVAFDLE
ncbi:hypersensitive response-inducing protein [Chaetomium strumarium]|uniref:Hypersensitive response-inducing protein n=1 Tax=Chaetomium strumarium TaxID=1170767 RepID=A0AAJ0M682_9PEZI|nr:hypersensitive response-inducing protein [Chaetomium strumarium]